MIPVLAILLAVSGPGAEPEDVPGLRGFVLQAMEADVSLQTAVIRSGLGSRQLRSAAAAYRPKLLPFYALTRPDASSFSENRGIGARWDTGWGLRLGASVQETRTEYWNDYFDFATVDRSAEVTLPVGRSFGRLPARVRLEAGRMATRQAERDLASARQQSILDSIGRYYGYLRALRSREVTRSALERARGSLELVDARYRLGDASQLDLDRARQRAQQAELSLLSVRSELRRLAREIQATYGIDVDRGGRFELPADDALELPWDRAEAVALILARDPAVLAAEEQGRLAELQLAWARRQLWPSLDVSMRVGERRSTADGQEGAYQDYQEVYLSSDLSLDLTDRRLALQSAKAGVELQRLRSRALREERTAHMLNTLDDLDRLQERLRLSGESLKTARRQAEVAELRYRRGLGSAFDVVESQGQLGRVELDHLGVRIDRIRAYYQVLRLAGELDLERLPG